MNSRTHSVFNTRRWDSQHGPPAARWARVIATEGGVLQSSVCQWAGFIQLWVWWKDSASEVLLLWYCCQAVEGLSDFFMVTVWVLQSAGTRSENMEDRNGCIVGLSEQVWAPPAGIGQTQQLQYAYSCEWSLFISVSNTDLYPGSSCRLIQLNKHLMTFVSVHFQIS